MAKCKECRCAETFVFVSECNDSSLYQCANCKRVVSATAEEMNDEYEVI
jgi:hypothetical protein